MAGTQPAKVGVSFDLSMVAEANKIYALWSCYARSAQAFDITVFKTSATELDAQTQSYSLIVSVGNRQSSIAVQF